MPSFLTANHQSALGLVTDDSPLAKLDKLKDLRRMSEIARIKGVQEDSQVVRFIDDLRSAGTSPPERKAESNEGFSSD